MLAYLFFSVRLKYRIR